MSLWTRVGISAQVEDTTGTLTLTEPAGVQAGDLLVACISYRQSGTQSFTAPSGWANCAAEVSGNNIANLTTSIGSGRMDYIVRGGSAPALAWTRTSAEVARGQIEAWRRTDGGVPFFDEASSATSPTAGTTGRTTAAITQEEEDTLYIMACCSGRNATCSAQTSTGTGAFTERSDTGSATGNDVGLSVSTAVRKATGTTGAFTWTTSASHRPATIVGAFRARYNVQADQGSFALTGQATTDPGPVVALTDGPDIEAVSFGALITKTGQNIGAASPERFIIVELSVGGFSVAPDNISYVEIDGTPMDKLIDAANSSVCGLALFALPWPTGTTADFDIQFNPSNVANVQIRIYSVTNGSYDDLAVVQAAAIVGNNTVSTFDVTRANSRSLHFITGPFYGSANANRIAWTNAIELQETSANLVGFGGVQCAVAQAYEAVGTGKTVTATSAGSATTPETTMCTLVIGPPFSGVFARRGLFALTGGSVTTPGVGCEFFGGGTLANSFDADELIWTGVDIGPVDTGRVIVVNFNLYQGGALPAILGATLGGVAMTHIQSVIIAADGQASVWFWIAEDTLETVELRLQFDADPSSITATYGLWNVTGANTTAPIADFDGVFSAVSDGSETLTMDIGEQGAMLASSWGPGYATPPLTVTWTGIEEDYDAVLLAVIQESYASVLFYAGSLAHAIVVTDDGSTLGFPEGKILSAVVLARAIPTIRLETDPGIFALTGQAGALLRAAGFAANNGAFALTGQDATLTKNLPFLVEPGSFTYTGQDALLLIPRIIADHGSFALSGQDVVFSYGRTFAIDYGEFIYTGQDVELIYGLRWQWTPEAPAGDGWTPDSVLLTSWTPEAPLSNTWTDIEE